MEFIDVLPPRARKRGPNQAKWDAVADELKANPGQWAVVEDGVKIHRSQALRTTLGSRGRGFKVAYREGVVYAMYDPTEV